MKRLNVMFSIIVALVFSGVAYGQSIKPVDVPESIQSNIASFEKSLVVAETAYTRSTIISTKKLIVELKAEIEKLEKAKKDDEASKVKGIKEKAEKHLETLEARLKELTDPPTKVEKKVDAKGFTALGNFKDGDILEIKASGRWGTGGWENGKRVMTGPDGEGNKKDNAFPYGAFVVRAVMPEIVHPPRIHTHSPTKVGSGGLFQVRAGSSEVVIYGSPVREPGTFYQEGALTVQVVSVKDSIGVWGGFNIVPVTKSPFGS